MKSWPCIYCERLVNELGAYVKISMNRYAHLSCHAKRCGEDAIACYQSEAEASRQEDLALAGIIAQTEALAKKNADLKAASTAAAVRAEVARREALAKADPAPVKDRFELLDLTADEMADMGAMREAARVMQAALLLCVRCKKALPVPPSTEHPKHCVTCWNSEIPGVKMPEQNIEKLQDAIKQGIHPLEVE